MKHVRAFSLLTLCLLFVHLAVAQTSPASPAPAPASSAASTLPRLVRFSGSAKDANGNAQTGVIGITFALYSEQTGGAPLWLETQNVQADSAGRYTALLGTTKAEGLPTDLFTSEQARWVGVQVSGQPEQPRTLLVSAPYALKAGDAETIGGLRPEAFMLAPSSGTSAGKYGSVAALPPAAQAKGSAPTPAALSGSGTANFIPRWTSSTALGNSILFQSGTGANAQIGVNNSAPTVRLDVAGRGRFLVSTTANALVGSQTGTGSAGNGVQGLTTSTGGDGVMGSATATTGTAAGVLGTSASATGFGLVGKGGIGVSGASTICCGSGGSFTGFSAPSNSGLSGTIGLTAFGGAGDPQDTGTNGGAGIVTVGGTGMGLFSGDGGTGIDSTGGNGFGDIGDAPGGIFRGGNGAFQGGDGVDAIAGSGTGVVAFGGNGNSSNGTTAGDGIDAYAGTDFNSFAGYFVGDVLVTGTITGAVKDFKIDHPQDPANKYLVHASVESSEMMNIYSGNVTTDGQGHATVQLPKWFETLNTDFRYALTVIGQFAQAIVASEISQSQFGISTDKPNVKVSWQVTAVRHDAFAKAHPLVVEQPKEARVRGFYLNPELYGASPEKQIEWARHPETMMRMKAMRTRQHTPAKATAKPVAAQHK